MRNFPFLSVVLRPAFFAVKSNLIHAEMAMSMTCTHLQLAMPFQREVHPGTTVSLMSSIDMPFRPAIGRLREEPATARDRTLAFVLDRSVGIMALCDPAYRNSPVFGSWRLRTSSSKQYVAS
jgi:hypothetical protein